MDKESKIIIARLLKMASEKFSNHGCNDLPDGFWDGISDEYKKNLVVEIELDNDEFKKEELEEDWERFIHQSDWILMSFFKRKLING